MLKHFLSRQVSATPVDEQEPLNASVLICLGLAILTSLGSRSTASQETLSILLSDDPLYKSTNGSLTGMRVIEADPTDYPRTESSFIENAVMANVGQVQNIGTFNVKALVYISK